MIFNEHIKRELVNEYAGSEKKRTVLMDDGHKYLLKFPDPVREEKNEISYINNAISEYIGCKVIKSLQLPVQEVILGEYKDERGITKVACACRDVRKSGETMHPIQTINLSSLDDKNDASLLNAMKFAERFGYIDALEIKEFYYDMFVADALLGNTDRHNGNWAVLTDEEGNARMSPIYDCGSSLSPLLDDEHLDYRHLSSDAVNTFSVILDEHGKRINYKDYLLSCKNDELNEAVKRIVGRIDMNTIHNIVEDIPYISDKRKSFYKELMDIRYEKILVPTLQKILSRNHEEIEKLTGDLSADSIRKFSVNLVDPIRKTEPYSLQTLEIISHQVFLKFRRVNNKFAILYDENDIVSGVAPIGRDYQDVKAFLCEINYALSQYYPDLDAPAIENVNAQNSMEIADQRDAVIEIDDEWER